MTTSKLWASYGPGLVQVNFIGNLWDLQGPGRVQFNRLDGVYYEAFGFI